MKNLTGKIALGVAVVVTLVVAIFYFTSGRGDRPQTVSIDPAFGEFISSYTAGVIGSGSTVRIVFARDFADSTMFGKEAPAGLFSFKPSMKGVTRWLDGRTVEFVPAQRMPSGQIYEVSFALSRLTDVPEGLSTFHYSFQIIPQNFDLVINNVKPYQVTDLKRQMIEGLLVTADYSDDQAIEKVMSATQDGNTLGIQWVHMNDGKQHAFTIENVTRKEKASMVQVKIDGSALGIKQASEQQIEIPALDDFKVTQIRVGQAAPQHLIVQFSDPLLERQNLDGLIRIEGLSSLDFEVKDNEVRVYLPVRQTGTKTVYVEAGIRNVLNYRMAKGGSFQIQFEQVKPAVRLVGNGSILPATDGLVMPFEAVNLKAVDLSVIRVFEKNVLQFFQVNKINGNQELRRVGRPILNKMVTLDNVGVTDLGKWNRFTIDLSTLINPEPGAIYQVRLGFKRSYLAYVCDDGEPQPETPNQLLGIEEEWSAPDYGEDSYWDSYEDYYYGSDYEWSQRDNPCHNSYYTSNRTVKRNVLASDLGLLAKQGGDGSTLIVVNDLRTTEPLGGVQLELYDYQQQLIGTATTSSDGKVTISSKEQPFMAVAKLGVQRGYLRLSDGESLSLSNFDVGGERVQRGIKGYLYGERGVWRPGDSLYLTFILEDKLKTLPAAHPVVFEMQNPMGQVVNRLVRSSSVNGFYNFNTVTSADAPTGNWLGRVKIGGTEFTQTIKIETVKPNRLKINLDFGVDKLKADQNLAGDLKVNWLHGAPGRNLKAEFDVTLTPTPTTFDRYADFTFDNPSIAFHSESQNIFDGYTDSEGHATINAVLKASDASPGKLNAVFRGKVFEESGNFSIDQFSLPFYPYETFVGLRLPQGDRRGMLLTDTTHTLDIVTVDPDGNPVSRNNLEVTLYKLDWRWWWDNSGNNANYMSARDSRAIARGKAQTSNGKGSWKFRVDQPEWGRFMVRVYDPASGHSAAKVVYIDWPGWAGRSRGGNQGATMLSFASDKPAYNIGERVEIAIPGSGQGRALVSVENGSRVIQTYWVQTQQGDTPFDFEVTKDMTPNIFVHVSLLQPHAQTINDLPIRLYGVIPIQVEDPNTHLEPVITMPEELEPGKEISIKVSEKNKRTMTYTLAMVDEGLLDLTRFQTPDAWQRFYAREALGVKTWDLYDQVMGSFGGRIERLLAIGGDGDLMAREDDSKANRFTPVVKFFGPFTLDGGSNEHRFMMPQYIGSVKTMVVAGYDGAYGKAEKVTPVRKPLMILATLPRVLGPDEVVKLPVTAFSMDKSIKNVQLEVKASGPVSVAGGSSKKIDMTGMEDLTTDFELSVKSETGIARIEVTATAGSFKASDQIEIQVRNPNPVVTKVQDVLLDASKAWTVPVAPIGVKGTNSAVLEVSSLPPVNLGQRLKYLLSYPHGCVEQTTSSVFPQLYLDRVKQLTDAEKSKIQTNVTAGIERLKSFVTRDGGFAYWPGGEDSNSWGSTYAGHFLLEAEAKGYYVPNDVIKRWKRYQKNKAQEWRKNEQASSNDLIQAYRLYSLALASDPDLASMNRLREMSGLETTASWMLAAAYAKIGQVEAARKLVGNLPTTVKPYTEMSYSYGSDLRDKAIILETLLMLNERTTAFDLLKQLSQSLSDGGYWMSTQTVAWSLKAIGLFASSEQKGNISFDYSYGGKNVSASTELPIAQVTLAVADNQMGELKVNNTGKGLLFVRVISEGIPARGEEDDASNNLKLDIAYTDVDGRPVDPSTLTQGDEFIAVVTVVNPGLRGAYKNLALHQIFPSGWEINNLRLNDTEGVLSSDDANYEDIRDDRVYTYFDLNPNQKKTFRVMLTASYAGNYYLPAVSCEAMYDHSVYARVRGRDVSVVKATSDD